MPGDVIARPAQEAADAEGVAAAIRCASWGGAAATVVGYGNMGAEYVKALRALGAGRIRVCSRSAGRLEPLRGVEGVELAAGGVEALACRPGPDEVGIVATPVLTLQDAARRMARLGFRRLLIEKPVALEAAAIDGLADELAAGGVEALGAYNRVCYPSFLEVRSRAAREGGITSCVYTFTEMIKPDWPARFPAEELARWGISNSLHVIGMAHGLIGAPAAWDGHRRGRVAWHPSGAVFVGSGVSERNIPFAYHADWGSKGRWSVEVHTAEASYRLCPLEQAFRKTVAVSDWEPIPAAGFAAGIKAGFVEQVAAALDPQVRRLIPLVPLREAAALTRYAERVFGYAAAPPGR
jgi:predicted dehydrogenase